MHDLPFGVEFLLHIKIMSFNLKSNNRNFIYTWIKMIWMLVVSSTCSMSSMECSESQKNVMCISETAIRWIASVKNKLWLIKIYFICFVVWKQKPRSHAQTNLRVVCIFRLCPWTSSKIVDSTETLDRLVPLIDKFIEGISVCKDCLRSINCLYIRLLEQAWFVVVVVVFFAVAHSDKNGICSTNML